MNIPKDLVYTKEHEWAKLEGRYATVGITHYAQEQLGDVVYVELPEEGVDVQQNFKFGTIESVKAVSDLFSPLSGKVVEKNEELAEHPEWVNQDPYGKGWMIRIEIGKEKEIKNLMSAGEYEKYLKGVKK